MKSQLYIRSKLFFLPLFVLCIYLTSCRKNEKIQNNEKSDEYSKIDSVHKYVGGNDFIIDLDRDGEFDIILTYSADANKWVHNRSFSVKAIAEQVKAHIISKEYHLARRVVKTVDYKGDSVEYSGYTNCEKDDSNYYSSTTYTFLQFTEQVNLEEYNYEQISVPFPIYSYYASSQVLPNNLGIIHSSTWYGHLPNTIPEYLHFYKNGNRYAVKFFSGEVYLYLSSVLKL